MRPVLIGFLLGLLFDVLLWFCGPVTCDFTDGLCYVSSPVAHVISWITGWKFQQEEGLLIYVLAVPITIPLLGICAGFLYAGIARFINRSRSEDH